MPARHVIATPGRALILAALALFGACGAEDSVSGTVLNGAHLKMAHVRLVIGILGSDGLPMQSLGGATLRRVNPVATTDGEGRFSVDIEPQDEENHFWMANATYTIAVERTDGTLAALRRNGKVVRFVIEPPRAIDLAGLVMDGK